MKRIRPRNYYRVEKHNPFGKEIGTILYISRFSYDLYWMSIATTPAKDITNIAGYFIKRLELLDYLKLGIFKPLSRIDKMLYML